MQIFKAFLGVAIICGCMLISDRPQTGPVMPASGLCDDPVWRCGPYSGD